VDDIDMTTEKLIQYIPMCNKVSSKAGN